MAVKLFLVPVLFFLFSFSHLSVAENRSPETIFNDFCFACHGTGWDDAPLIGDSFAWEERMERGLEDLLKNTVEGFNAMPPKGACDNCNKEELLAVIQYMTEE